MLMGNLMKISDMVLRKGVNVIDALKIFSLFIPPLLRYTLPLSFFLGVLLAMGRLISDNEIVAIRVAGVSLFKILNILLIVGIMFSLFLFILNDKFIPEFKYRYRSYIKNIYSKNISALIEPGIFMEHFKNHIVYVSDKNENRLKSVFIYELDDNDEVSKVTFAKRGEFVAEGNVLKMKLEDVFYHEVNATDKKDVRGNFKIFFKDIPTESQEKIEVEKKPSDMGLKELKKTIASLKEKGIYPREYIAEMNERISLSFSIIAFAILGFGVSLAVKHRERSINFGIAFLAAGIYYLLSILGKTVIEYKVVPPAIGVWLPNIAIVLIGGYFIYRNAYPR